LNLEILKGRPIILIIDETEIKRGNTTDYVKRQYIGNLGKVENGIVAVTAYGMFWWNDIYYLKFPSLVKISQEINISKPQIGAMLIRKLQLMGFKFNLVLADSLSGERGRIYIYIR